MTKTNEQPSGITLGGVKFYNVREIAQILHCTPNSVRKYIKLGRIAGKTISGTILVTEKDLNKFLNGHE